MALRNATENYLSVALYLDSFKNLWSLKWDSTARRITGLFFSMGPCCYKNSAPQYGWLLKISLNAFREHLSQSARACAGVHGSKFDQSLYLWIEDSKNVHTLSPKASWRMSPLLYVPQPHWLALQNWTINKSCQDHTCNSVIWWTALWSQAGFIKNPTSTT
jgi:hypothetical protein